jgi:hypothetical protein
MKKPLKAAPKNDIIKQVRTGGGQKNGRTHKNSIAAFE